MGQYPGTHGDRIDATVDDFYAANPDSVYLYIHASLLQQDCVPPEVIAQLYTVREQE